jgi:hypothetical protein
MYANEIIDLGHNMLATLNQLPMVRRLPAAPDGSRMVPYELQCARARVQEAVFWAIQFLAQ